MIISFNPQVFETDQEDILKRLVQIFDLIIIDRNLFDLVDIHSFVFTVFEENTAKYILDESKFSKEYLSDSDKRRLKAFFEMLAFETSYIDKLRRKYLKTLHIGLEADEVHPELAFKILNTPSKIIVENAVNDWKFIKGIINKYKNHPRRKSIYLLINDSINNLYLVAEHAGGKGQIRNRFEDLKEHLYEDIHKYKLMTIFDSDRNNNVSLNNDQNSLINYFKEKEVNYADAIHEDSDLIIWHMFYKTELENYVSIDVLVAELQLMEIERADLHSKTPDEIDFIDFEHYLRSNPNNISVKRDFPELFLKEWTRDKIEERCEHHKVSIKLPNNTLEEVSEIEQLLLKIAKII